MTRNRTKAPTQNFIKIRISDFFVFGQENILDFDNFLTKLDLKIKQISKHPYSCPESKEFGNLFKCVVTKQTTFFYRVNEEREEIEIITVFDTRRDPKNSNLEE